MGGLIGNALGQNPSSSANPLTGNAPPGPNPFAGSAPPQPSAPGANPTGSSNGAPNLEAIFRA